MLCLAQAPCVFTKEKNECTTLIDAANKVQELLSHASPKGQTIEISLVHQITGTVQSHVP